MKVIKIDKIVLFHALSFEVFELNVQSIYEDIE
jgi:hypothetical protein